MPDEHSIEVVAIDAEIKIVGLSYEKLGLPATIESLEKMWAMYGEQYRYRVENAVAPHVDYGINANLLTDRHEYIAGCAVTEIGPIPEDWACFTIPPGKYVKYTSGTMGGLFENHGEIRAWARANGTPIYDGFEIEAYSDGAFDGRAVEMYILFPVKN